MSSDSADPVRPGGAGRSAPGPDSRALEAILEGLDEAVFTKDREGRFRYVNAGFEKQVGLSRADVLGRRADEVPGLTSDAPGVEALDDEELAEGRSVTRLVEEGGRVRRVTKRPLVGADGSFEGIVGSSTDITDQVDAARHNALLAAVVASSPDVIFTLDTELRGTSLNAAGERFAGASEASLLGRSAMEMSPRRDIEAAYHRALSGEMVVLPEETVELPTGARTFHQTTIGPIRTSDGDVVGVVSVLRDVTEARLAQERQAELERQLEHRERLDSLGHLAGGVAHDFNNLLAASNLTAEMLAAALPEGSDEQAQAHQIAEIGSRAAALTAQLLMAARKDQPLATLVDLNDVVRRADRLLGRTLGEQVRRQLDLTAVTCLVEADPARLEQVVINLAVNARDAMPRGGTLLIRTEIVAVDEALRAELGTRGTGDHVVLSVTDQGVGMDEDTRRKAFDPFFTTKERGRGTGLGLSTVYGIASQAGGGASLISQPGIGTVVKVALPRATGGPAAAPELPGEEESRGTGQHVLVVEDEDALREVARRLLVRAGYRVQAFADGSQMLEALAEMPETPDLLLTDVVLPGLSGPASAVRAQAARPGLRVLFMSGYTAGLTEGLDPSELLTKPFTSQTLTEAVARALADGG